MAVGIGILSVVTAIGSVVTMLTIDNMRQQEYTTQRRELQADLSAATRGPRQLRTALSGSIGCLGISASNVQPRCTASTGFIGFAAQHGGQTITNGNGLGCYSVKGVSCPVPISNICPAECPVRVTTQYQLLCPGSGARTDCPSNQATLLVRYELGPEPTTADPKDTFRPIRAVQVIQPKTLWGDINKLSEGAAAVELSSEPNRQVQACPNGQIMIGVQANGQPLCEDLTEATKQCAAGTVFRGFTQPVAGGPLVATCADATCPDVSGKKQVFAGFTAAGVKICNEINGNDTVCDPGTAGSPTGVFMTGINQGTSRPICKRKTCLPGEIFVNLLPDGSVRCVKTDPWLPRCPTSGPCSSPPNPLPPTTGVFYTTATTPPVSVGYNGAPWISAWVDGEPRQGYRMTYKNFVGGPVSTTTIDGLFGDSLTATPRGVKTCQLHGAQNDTTLHRCTHTWSEVTRAAGTCQNSSWTFTAPNTCSLTVRHPLGGCEIPEVSVPLIPGPGCQGSCGTPANADCSAVATAIVGRCCQYRFNTFTEASERIQNYSENYAVSAVNFNNGSSNDGSASCANPPTAATGSVSATTPTNLALGTRFNDLFRASIRASCNYQYAP